jgi:phosphatidylethanolamine-binding protein (PEBP) family uncharacterized protein
MDAQGDALGRAVAAARDMNKPGLGLRSILMVVVLAVLLLISCGSETTTIIEKLEKPPMTLTSPAFKHGEALPDIYAYSGWWTQPAISPPLEWTNVPDRTSCFALVLYDPRADACGEYSVNWFALEGAGGRGADAGSGLGGYRGIGQARGRPRRFLFVLYALDAPVDCTFLIRGPGEFEQAAAGHILAKAELACCQKRAPLSIPKML